MQEAVEAAGSARALRAMAEGRPAGNYAVHNKIATKCRHNVPKKLTKTMIAAAIAGFEEQKRQIDAEIAALRAIGRESGTATPNSESGKHPRRRMSAASRKNMALAQQKRWAAKKVAPEPEATAKPKRKLSAAGKKRIIAASNDTGRRSGLLQRNPRSPSDLLISESLIMGIEEACGAVCGSAGAGPGAFGTVRPKLPAGPPGGGSREPALSRGIHAICYMNGQACM
jgi:hypothetical protein